MLQREPVVLPRLSRTIDDIRASVFAHVEKVQTEFADRGWLPLRLNLNKGVCRGMLEIYCWGYWQIYSLLQRLMQQAVPATATGDWLNTHAATVNLARRPATKARGNIRFLRTPSYSLRSGVHAGDASALADCAGSASRRAVAAAIPSGSNGQNILIPKGRIVRTLPDGAGVVYRYSSLEPAVLPAGETYVDVLCEAEEYGAGSNAVSGQICELVTPVEGIGGVINVMGWLTAEGANEETDAQLRERYALAWAANNGCTKHAYQSWALSVPGVTSVSILDRHPRGEGTVDIVVRGADVLPTESLLEKVRAAIAPNVPINDDWLVKAPVAINCVINGTLEYVSGGADEIRQTAENRLRALFAETSPLADVMALQIGQDLTLDLLTHTVMAIPGVKRVTWGSPAEEMVEVPADGVARLESLVITTVMGTEI